MPEDVTDNPTTGTTEGSSGEGETTTEPFDLDRAMTTIRTLRGEIKSYKSSLKDLETLRTEKQQREQAQMSEQEKLQQRLQQLEAQVAFEKQERNDREIDFQIERAATKLGLVDTEVARMLLNKANLEYNPDGKPTNVESALKELVKLKPYLVAGQGVAGEVSAAGKMSPTNPARPTGTAGGGSKKTYTVEQISDHAFFRANQKEIRLAMQEGRIER